MMAKRISLALAVVVVLTTTASAAPAGNGTESAFRSDCVRWIPKGRYTAAEGGAKHYPTYVTSETCELHCVTIHNCQGYEVDYGSSPDRIGCWIHTDPSKMASLKPSKYISLYAFNRDCAGDCQKWSELYDYRSTSGGGRVDKEAISLEQCKDTCTKRKGCIAFDFASTSEAKEHCIIYTSADPLAEVIPADGFVQYRHDKDCSNM